MVLRMPIQIAAALPLLALAGCTSAPQDPSPRFSYIPTTSYTTTGKSVTGSALVPEACLGEPADQAPAPGETDMTVVPQLGPHLPPGCANAYNLQAMVENERDLIEGRKLGSAPAAPSARAARRYLYEESDALGGANESTSLTGGTQGLGG